MFLTKEARHEIAKSYFRSMDALAARLPGEAIVRAIVDFLYAFSRTIDIGPTGTIFIRDPLHDEFHQEPKFQLFVFPYNADDIAVLPEDCVCALNLRSSQQVAGYMGEAKVLSLNADKKLSPFMQGLILLHEGYHAWMLQTRPRDVLSSAEHEYEAHCLDQSWLMKIGRIGYREVLERIEQHILGQFGNDPLVPMMTFKAPPYPAEVDDFMGAPQDEDEVSRRLLMICLHAVFRIKHRTGLSRHDLVKTLGPMVA